MRIQKTSTSPQPLSHGCRGALRTPIRAYWSRSLRVIRLFIGFRVLVTFMYNEEAGNYHFLLRLLELGKRMEIRHAPCCIPTVHAREGGREHALQACEREKPRCILKANSVA